MISVGVISVLSGVAVAVNKAGTVGVAVGKLSGIAGMEVGRIGNAVGAGVVVGISGTNTKAGLPFSLDTGE